MVVRTVVGTTGVRRNPATALEHVVADSVVEGLVRVLPPLSDMEPY